MDHRSQVTVSGGNQPHVHANRLMSTDSFYKTALQILRLAMFLGHELPPPLPRVMSADSPSTTPPPRL